MPSPRLLARAFAFAIAFAVTAVPASAFATQLELRSNPPGLQLSVDGRPAITPFTRTFEPGQQVTLDAPDPQTLLGYDYAFGAWGGLPIPKRSTITVGTEDAVYEANFRFTGRRTVLGADMIGDHVSEAPPGRGEAYRTLAARSATLDRLRLYLDATSDATQLSLGLYADAGGTPGALLGSGTAATPQAGAWNEVELDQHPKLVAGRSYWIGLLNPATGAGVLRWRDRAGGSGGGDETTRGGGPSPPPPPGGPRAALPARPPPPPGAGPPPPPPPPGGGAEARG